MNRKNGPKMVLMYAVWAIACTCLGAAWSGAQPIDQPVEIADPSLEAVILDQLGKEEGPVMQSEMATLTCMRASLCNIQVLDGIEHAVNLTGLNLGLNSITDISQLSGLTKLRDVSLNGNLISDISPLSHLEALEILCLGQNLIMDITPLAGLNNLRYLGLKDNMVRDIHPLAELESLAHMDLSDNWISDVRPILGLPNLANAYGHPAISIERNYIDTSEDSLAKSVFEELDAREHIKAIYTPQTQYDTWANHPVRPDGTADTCDWMGVLFTPFAPWVWCEQTSGWLYIPDACAQAGRGWIYVPDMECLQAYRANESQWAWCFCLDRWIYIPDSSLAEGHGWAYLPG